jgi:Flavin containing amine oxidoreductase
LFVASTYEDILADLLDPVANLANLRLGCEVTQIVYRTGVVDIEAADGFQGSFEKAIVTTPLGWLKRNEDVFSPPLTPSLSRAIHRLGYGNLDRVFIKFPRAFWNDRLNGDQALKTPVFPIESLFLPPKYAVDTNPAKWRIEIISLSGLPEPFAQPIIMFFVYGQWGRYITGLVQGMKQDSEEYYRILDEHFRPYYSKLSNYDATSHECKPLEFLSTDWQNDRLAGYGAFSNLPVGSGDCAQHFEALREGMGNRGIWFAGEHTSPPGGLGTVTGAYWSGEDAAKRVAHQYQIPISL